MLQAGRDEHVGLEVAIIVNPREIPENILIGIFMNSKMVKFKEVKRCS